MSAVEDRQADLSRCRQAVGTCALALVLEPARNHLGEHACSPPTDCVMAFKVGAGRRGDNSPRWSRPPALPAPSPKGLGRSLAGDLGGRILTACAMVAAGKASQTARWRRA